MDCIELSPVIHDTNIQKILPISENCDNESVKNIEKKEEIVEEISTIPSSVSDDPLKQEEKENSMSVTDDPLKQEEKFDLGDIDMDSDGLFELENDIIKAKNNIDFNNFLTSEDVSKVVELIEQVEKETCEFENFEESENSMSSTESNGKLIIDEDQDFDDETTLAERVASAILSPSSIKITHDFSNQPSTSQQDVYDPQNQGKNWEEFYNTTGGNDACEFYDTTAEDDVYEEAERNKEQDVEIFEKQTPVQSAAADDDDDDDDEEEEEEEDDDPIDVNLKLKKLRKKIEQENKKKRGKLSVEDKIRVVTLARENPGWTIGKIRDKSKCNKLRQRRQIFLWEQQLKLEDNSKEQRQLEKINSWVISKFIQYKKNKQKVTNIMLRDWGLAASRKYKNRDFKFTASDGWIFRFKKANKIIGHWQNLYFSGASSGLNNKSSLIIDNEELLLDNEETARNDIVTPPNELRVNERDNGPSAFNPYVQRPEQSYPHPGFSYEQPPVNMPTNYYNNSHQYPHEWGFQPPPNYYYPDNYYDPRFYNNGNWYWNYNGNRQNYIDLTGESSNYQMQNQHVNRASSDGNSTHSPEIYQASRQVPCKVIHQAQVHQENHQQVDAQQKNQQVVVGNQEMQDVDKLVIRNIGGETSKKRVLKNSEKNSTPVIVNVLSKGDAEKYFSPKKNNGKKRVEE